MKKVFFTMLVLVLTTWACNLSFQNSQVVVPTPTFEPTTVIYVVIEPTATATLAVTDTPLPTATQTLPPEITLTKNSNCRRGPSEYYYISDQIAKEKDNVPVSLSVIAQNEGGSWWQVINATNQECWIFSENTRPNSDFSALPIKEGPPLPSVPGNFFVTNQVCQPGPKKFEITFSWTSGANTEGFRMYRNGNQIIQLKPEKLSYKDIKAPLGINLTYELEAFNQNGTSQKVIQIVTACK